ncbi:MAG: hypothetical protein PHX83_07985 [Acidobacteriia bacterium]|nr:hypothetical protein [Terriglobia bacterium]
MFNATDPATFWLNLTNVALGLVTLACVIVVGRVVYSEMVMIRKRKSVKEDDHAFLIPELGFTMADGGESVAPTLPHVHGDCVSDDEEPHIVRSVN